MTLPVGSEYVALGSSFAAGPGLKPRSAGASRASGRSDSNYAHLVAARLGLSLNDVTFSGATTDDILRGTPERTAQIDSVSASTRLVTITAGGNDIGYLPALTLASLPWPLRALPGVRRRVAGLTDEAATDDRFRALAASLTTVVREIRMRARDARILLVDYLSILPPAGSTDAQTAVLQHSPYGDLTRWGRDVALRLSRTFETVAAAEGCGFVRVGERSREHHAWSTEPWTRRFHLSLRGGAPYHPDAAGMSAVAQMIVDDLDQGAHGVGSQHGRRKGYENDGCDDSPSGPVAPSTRTTTVDDDHHQQNPHDHEGRSTETTIGENEYGGCGRGGRAQQDGDRGPRSVGQRSRTRGERARRCR
jgi:lysophospholipase L1-like esterase